MSRLDCRGYDRACERMFSVRYELGLLKRFLRCGQFVFFVRCELRMKKQLRTVLFFVTMQHVVVISSQHFRTTNLSHLVFWILTLMMGPVSCLESLVINYYYLLHNNPEECRCHVLRGGSLNSRLRNSCTWSTTRV